MATWVSEQQYRQPNGEVQPFIHYQPQPAGPRDLHRCDPGNAHLALQLRETGCNAGYNHGSNICRPPTQDNPTPRRRENDSCHSLPKTLCFALGNVILSCLAVIGLLVLLKHVNSPLLRSEGQSDQTELILIGSNDQRECQPCRGNEQRDEGSSKRPNCCMVNQEALKRFIEKITRETLSEQLSAAPRQRNASSTAGRETLGRSDCGALFYLYEDKNSAMITPDSQRYSLLRGWNDAGNVAYRHPCIGYNNLTGAVTVTQDGFYVVYSHLAFGWAPSVDSNPPSTFLGQQIRVEISPDVEPEPISADKRFIQPNNPSASANPSYNSRTMTIRYLRSGSKLTVHAKPLELVAIGNADSSFGLYKL